MHDMYIAGPWITEHEEKIVLDAIRNGWYGKNAYYYVEKFETEFAKYHNRKYALMTPNCTSAIHLILYALNIGPGDEVIAPECTWVASVSPVKLVRANPIFADIDPINWCIDPKSLEANITQKTKAVIMVDLYGNMPEIDSIQKICDQHNIVLIEDAAGALGSCYKNIRAGKFGRASVFSFHRTKTITTGEGGMLLLDDDELFQRCKFLRDHGRSSTIPYWAVEATFKYMPFNVQAALGYAQFQRINELIEKKRWILKTYQTALADLPDLYFNPEPAHVINAAWSSTLVIGKSYKIDKAEMMKRLTQLGFPARPFFYPLTMQPAFPGREQESRARNPVAYDVSNRGINLPAALNITEDLITQYCGAIRTILTNPL